MKKKAGLWNNLILVLWKNLQAAFPNSPSPSQERKKKRKKGKKKKKNTVL